MDEVSKFLNSLNLQNGETVVVACSGGPDSMFLLKLLHDRGLKCVCAHVNHNVRSKSASEYEFLKKYCLKNDIIFEGTTIKDYPHDNFHNYARNYRYDFFGKCLEKYDSKYLFTAHHGDDLVETIIMRLVRGSTGEGYAGFASFCDNGKYKIIRPLIFFSKDEIRKLDNLYDIPYVTDESNDEDHYTRNRIRHHVLPILKAENPQVNGKFLNFSKKVRRMAQYIDDVAKKELDKILSDGKLDIIKSKKLDEAVKERVVELLLKDKYDDKLYCINDQHVEAILDVIDSDKPNLEVSLPLDIRFIREYDKAYFVSNIGDSKDLDIVIDGEVSVFDGKIRRIIDSEEKSNYIIRLNSKELTLPLKVRYRKKGDVMRVKNLNGTKKVSDVFIDAKVGKSKRDVWPIVVDSNDLILWIPGLKKSEFDIPIGECYDIILKYEKGEILNEQEN